MADRGNKRTMTGVVVSDKMAKTVVVLSERLVKHPRFHKYFRRHVKYKVHDGKGICNIGDKVLIVESPPLSKDKRWRIGKVLQKAK
ncbi:MAG: 30S ribosomal protein S17 [Syntrophobacterales bacterium]|nr:30S ribosomal protein S17 [Syntrophobacterales bacterium]